MKKTVIIQNIINKKVIINKKGGCFSEVVEVSINEIIFIPKEIDSALAAGTFVNTLTSYVSLCEIIKVKKNQNILITCVSGGAVQHSIKLAKSIGANVIAIISDKKENFVRKIGAESTIMLKSEELKNISNYRNKYKVDVIIDINGLIKVKKFLASLDGMEKYVILGFMDKNF